MQGTARARQAAAVSRATDWHAIDWQSVNSNVRRLQASIVKATQAQRWRKVKSLQRLLTRSFSGKALAVRRVTENQGKRTTGVDQVCWETPDKKMAAIYTLQRRGYQPLPVLANLSLDGLETKLRDKFPRTKNGQSGMVKMVRYADDFIITGRTKELLEEEVKPLVEEHLSERGLELSREKTRTVHIEEGFDFLGQTVRKHNGKLLIKPAKRNTRSHLAKVRKVLNTNKQTRAGNLIVQLNPIIRGWANYHRHVVSTAVYSSVDHALYEALWRWSVRRHPNKRAAWVKQKYFTDSGGDNWVFHGETTENKKVRLLKATSVPITRHVKVKGEANPYDPAWETYFERRLDVKMEANLKGDKKLFRLWMEQQGLCPICHQKITRITGWHCHHIIWRVNGGKDGNSNRVLLHPNCHRQVHSQKLEVVKPRSQRSVR